MDWANSLYEALVLRGLNPHEWKINYECPSTGGVVAIGFPEARVGLAFIGNDTEPLINDGWDIVRVNIQDMPLFDSVWRKLAELDVLVETKQSANEMIKSGSSQEAALLQGILRAGLPKPDRNYRLLREDGRELTVPDFTWPEFKLAFFVDGLWWHVGKDGDEKRKEILASKDENAIKEAEKASLSRRQRDTANRSAMTVMGWSYLECTDADLETPEGVQKQVDLIKSMMRTIHSEKVKNTNQQSIDTNADMTEIHPVDGETTTEQPKRKLNAATIRPKRNLVHQENADVAKEKPAKVTPETEEADATQQQPTSDSRVDDFMDLFG